MTIPTSAGGVTAALLLLFAAGCFDMGLDRADFNGPGGGDASGGHGDGGGGDGGGGDGSGGDGGGGAATPNPDLPPCTTYLATLADGGDDANAGSDLAPWATFAHAMTQLTPGDVLCIEDGIYTEPLWPTVSGTDAASVWFRARHPGAVTIDGGGSASALRISNVHHVGVAGLSLRNSGEAPVASVSSPDGQPASGDMATHHVVLQQLSVRGSAISTNSVAFTVGRANDVLVEDSWIYGNGRYTMLVYGARATTVRRTVARWDNWIGDQSKPNDPRFSLGIYNSHDCVIEDVVLIDAGERPTGTSGDKGALKVAGGDNGDTAPYVNAVNNTFTGLVVVNNVGAAANIQARDEPHTGNTFRHVAALGNDAGVVASGNVVGTSFDHVTSYGNGLYGYAQWDPTVVGTTITDSVVFDSALFAFFGGPSEDYNVVFGNNGGNDYQAGTTPGSHTLVIDPQLSFLLDNASSVLDENLGSDGLRRGARITQRTVDQVLTDDPLWPWPNEARIRADFCDPIALAELGRVGTNEPTWCSQDVTLSEYIWELLGNSMPAN